MEDQCLGKKRKTEEKVVESTCRKIIKETSPTKRSSLVCDNISLENISSESSNKSCQHNSNASEDVSPHCQKSVETINITTYESHTTPNEEVKGDDICPGNMSEKDATNKSVALNCDSMPPAIVENDRKSDYYYPSYMGCRSVNEFEKLNRIEEGMYGVVFRAKDLRTGETVALKRLKMEREREGFPITSLREINCLLKAHHENIVHVREVVVGNNMDKIFIVMEYVEHDLKSLMEMMTQPFTLGETKTMLIQLLRGVMHLHDNWIIHRDIKTSNLLLNHRGILKIGDFGLAREYGSPLKSYTPIVVTLWYRAPELLLGIKEYSYPIDIWSVGCVFAELLSKKPLFPAKTEIEQINRIFQELGTPNDEVWPGPPAFSELPFSKKVNFKMFAHNRLKSRFSTKLTDCGLKLLNKFLLYDPNKRITAEEALSHDLFMESPLPVPPALFPTWPTKHERDNHLKRKENPSPQAPHGGPNFNNQMDEDIMQPGLFQNQSSIGGGFTMFAEGKGKVTGGMVGGFTLKF